jgi:hypothetical protein
MTGVGVGRSLRALALAIGLAGGLAAVTLAVTHTHLGNERTCTSPVCVHCGGGVVVQPAPLFTGDPQSAPPAPDGTPRTNPARRYQLQLDHSGCAPPTA